VSTYVEPTTDILEETLLTALQLHENEVMRAYKTVNDLYIEPISFTVPRRAETFQSDIFPPCTGSKPAMSASEWLGGKTALPPKIDLESKYEGNAPVEVAADYKPPAAAPAPTPAPAAKPAPKPEPEPVRAAPPSVAQQKGSMSAAASKFQDDEDDKDDEAETSSFEEVQKPVSRAALPVRSDPKPQPQAQAKPPSPIKSSAPFAGASSSARSPQPSPALSQSGSGSGSVEASLEQIKQLIEAQTKVITAQGEKITAQGDAMAHLTGEVETLKKRVVSGSQDQSERIRQLELELEEARS
jgi:coronin-1B/1C/6